MINNGSMHYDHDRDGTHTMIGGCEVKFRNFAHDTFINIRYENDVITVTHDLDNKRAWEPCLRVEGVKLPTGYYFGASAATGINNSELDMQSCTVQSVSRRSSRWVQSVQKQTFMFRLTLNDRRMEFFFS